MNIIDDFLTVNPNTRPGILRRETRGIVMHYTGWLGQPCPAKNTRDFFESLKSGTHGAASANYVVGLQGEILRLMPDEEMSYTSGWYDYSDLVYSTLGGNPNLFTIGVEVAAAQADGAYTEETYQAQIDLCVFLCEKYKLSSKQIYRHYDMCGPKFGQKECPLWFVRNPDEWEKFKKAVAGRLGE